MNLEKLNAIEKRIQSLDKITPERKSEILTLVSELKSEIADLEESHQEHAESVSGLISVSTHEATRTERNERSLELVLEALRSSVESIESSHPSLVKTVNALSLMLSNLGI
jgi:chromosome segregation ATPase